jgi:hypothetical protein
MAEKTGLRNPFFLDPRGVKEQDEEAKGRGP